MSGSVASAGVITAILGAALTVTGAGATLVNGQVAHGAADAAALAAADTLLGFSTGDPCARARDIAQQNGTVLISCTVQQTSVLVRVAATSLGIRLESSARAGLSEAR